ncbi:MAG: EFR1 family ferrodoxin [Promethearchaeota archaeon]|jgi:flavodoxin/ferredoxin
MDVNIIFFSQTGGTKKIANKIREGVLRTGNTCEINKMKVSNTKKLNRYDIIGIGTPTFYYREPLNVYNFIKSIDKIDGKHCFIFCTHGSIIGNTFYYMSEELTKKGYLVIGAFDSYSESSIQFYPKVMHTANHPDEIEMEEAIKFGENICGVSKSIQNKDISMIPKFELIQDTWWFNQSKMLTLDVLRQINPVFEIDTERCTQCLTCQDNCPVNAINVESEPPEIQAEGCIYCLYCEKSCPEGAIIADWKRMVRSSKGNLKLYVNALKEAENNGKFRPYVDYENIV